MLWLFYRNESLRTTFNGQLPLLSASHSSMYMLWIHTATATTFHLCCVSVDRFIAIRFPFRYQDIVTKKRCCTVIILVWLISLDLLRNIASAVLWLSLAFITFIASLFVITFCYIFMFKAARRQCRRMFPSQNRQSFLTKKFYENILWKWFYEKFQSYEDGQLYYRCLHCFLDTRSCLTRSSFLLYSDESSL